MTYHLQIVTPDGLHYEGQVERIIVPTIQGPVGILARHINYVTALGMGPAKITTPEGLRLAACIGGMVVVNDGAVRVLSTTFEWAEDIDVARAEASLQRAETMLADPNADEQARAYAKARLQRARVRLGVAQANNK